jgi:hypothetical protein
MQRKKLKGTGFPFAILAGIASDILMSNLRGSGRRSKIKAGRRSRRSLAMGSKRLYGRGFFGDVWKFLKPHLPRMLRFGSKLAKEGISTGATTLANKLADRFPKQSQNIREATNIGKSLATSGVDRLQSLANDKLQGGYVRIAGKYMQGGYVRIAGMRKKQNHLLGGKSKLKKIKHYKIKYTGKGISARPDTTIQF